MGIEEYKYGDPIPEKYRNRLYDWEGGGYSGCFWEMNQGLVDKEGHWHPLYSTGRDGLDQHEWYDRKISNLKNELGYDVTLVSVQHEEARHRAVEEVFGKKWYEVRGAPEDNPDVMAKLEKEDVRYAEWCKRKAEYDAEKTHRLDMMFMQVVLGEDSRDRFEEVGRIDEENIKETCRKFCESYKGNVGMMANCLDKMSKLGYASWCTCSDCGEQFQPWDYEELSCSIDSQSYHGDGGIGVIMTRILCDECHSNAECRECFDLDRPNERRNDGRDDWGDYDFLACVILDWFDVCWGCADRFECDELKRWDKTLEQRVNTDLGERYYKLAGKISEENGDLEGHKLYEELKKTMSGRKRINEIRDLLEDAARNHFGNSFDDDWFADRYDTEDPRQMRLPGV